MNSNDLQTRLKLRESELKNISIELVSFLIEGSRSATLANIQKLQAKIDDIRDSIADDYKNSSLALKELEKIKANQPKLEEISELENRIREIKNSLI